MNADDSARTHLRETIIDLIRCRPDDWPEILAKQAGVACGMDYRPLNLLTDASAQIAAMAKQLGDERQEA